MLTYVCGLSRGVGAPRDKPHTCVSMENLRFLMPGISISRRFGVKSDDLQIFINSIIWNENINQKLFFALVFRFWNDS